VVVARASTTSDPFNAIAEPRRRHILEFLGKGERSVTDIADALELNQPSVTKHLQVLLNVGLVDVRREGRRTMYRTNFDQLRTIHDWSSMFAHHWRGHLRRIKAHAEDKQVTICMEYLNSKVNHKDYMFDHIAWGVDVMKRVNSPRVKILYDIYHAQIMDGDIVRNIRDHFQWIGHFHTGGNPGRHEIDDTNELNYRFIMQAIADLGFTGFVSHEYSPSPGHDPIATLEKAIEICDV